MATRGRAIETNSVEDLCSLDLLRSENFPFFGLSLLSLLTVRLFTLATLAIGVLLLFLPLGLDIVFLLAFLEESLLVPARMAIGLIEVLKT